MGARILSSRAGKAIVWAGAAGIFVLAGLVWFDRLTVEGTAQAPKASAAVASALPSPGIRLPDPPPPEAYRAFTERPLFHPGRRPFPERSALLAAAQATPAPRVLPVPQGLSLRGTVISGPFRSAIFERIAKKDYIRIEEGAQLEGWTLIKITRSEILLQGAGQELSMKLESNPR
jgi:hypothetical protein